MSVNKPLASKTLLFKHVLTATYVAAILEEKTASDGGKKHSNDRGSDFTLTII